MEMKMMMKKKYQVEDQVGYLGYIQNWFMNNTVWFLMSNPDYLLLFYFRFHELG